MPRQVFYSNYLRPCLRVKQANNERNLPKFPIRLRFSHKKKAESWNLIKLFRVSRCFIISRYIPESLGVEVEEWFCGNHKMLSRSTSEIRGENDGGKSLIKLGTMFDGAKKGMWKLGKNQVIRSSIILSFALDWGCFPNGAFFHREAHRRSEWEKSNYPFSLVDKLFTL